MAAPEEPKEHRGPFFRIGSGFAGYRDTLARRVGDSSHTSVTGVGSTSVFMLGGNVSRRLVLGGSYWTMTALATDARGHGTNPPVPTGDSSPTVTVFGPFFTYYFDPNGGVTLNGSLGVAAVGSLSEKGAAWGGGGTFTVGYDWRLGGDWSVGLATGVAGAVTARTVDGTRVWHTVSASPTMMFTVTFH